MAGGEGLPQDIATIIQSCQPYWVDSFQDGLKVPPPDVPHPSGFLLMPDEMKMWIQYPRPGFWIDVFKSGERKREQDWILLDLEVLGPSALVCKEKARPLILAWTA
ncbi:unnamed protein product [Calypogeia fissa]